MKSRVHLALAFALVGLLTEPSFGNARASVAETVTAAQAESSAETSSPAEVLDATSETLASADATEFSAAAESALASYKAPVDPATAAQRALSAGKRLAHGTSTIAQLWLLLYSQAVIEQSRLAPVMNGRKMSVLQIAEITASSFINNIGLYSSMLCGELTGCVISKPLKSFELSLGAGGLKPQIAAGMVGMARSGAVMLAFMAGSSLINQAKFGLTEADQQIAQHVQVAKMLIGGGTAEERRVAGLIVVNALAILEFNKQPENSREWISNTFRLNANGETVTSLLGFSLGMAAAGALVGTPTIPVLGTMIGWGAGFFGGIAGGLVAYILPTPWKDDVSDVMYAGREHFALQELGRNMAVLKSYQRLLDKADVNANLYAQGFTQYLGYRVSTLDQIITAYMERLETAYERFGQAQNILGQIAATPNLPFIHEGLTPEELSNPKAVALTPPERVNADYVKKKADSLKLIDTYFDGLAFNSLREMQALEDFVEDSDAFPESARSPLMTAVENERRLLRVFQTMKAALLSDADAPQLKGLNAKQIASLNVKSQTLLNQYNLRGFKRKALLR